MSAEVLRRQQSSIDLYESSAVMDDIQLVRQRAKLLARSKSLPVQVLQTKRRASIDRLNRDFRRSLQVQLTATFMSSTSEPTETKERGSSIKFDPAIDMQVAVTNGDEDEMKKLISEHGQVIVNRREPTGLPPSMRAIFEGQLNSLQLLIDSGADITAHDPEHWNILHVAAAMEDFDSIEVIMASMSHRKLAVLLGEENACGQKPVELAEDEEMIKFLEQTATNLSLLL